MSATPSPGLYIVATPIGNLGDISDRARAIFAAADVVACEDTRVAGKLLHLLNITASSATEGDLKRKIPLLRHDDHADDAARAALIARAHSEVVVLVSDAGTPLISDPGYRLVRDARAAGVMVTAVPGACAAVAALSISGLPTDRFLFAGFLPPKAGARDRAITELAAIPATLVFYESGPRLPATLAALARLLGERDGSVARELTKLHEECVTAPLAELAQHYASPPKGEIVIIVGPPQVLASETADQATIDAALTEALANLSVAQAAKRVSVALHIPREVAYARALLLAGKV